MDRLLDQFGREMVKLFDSNNSKGITIHIIRNERDRNIRIVKESFCKIKKIIGIAGRRIDSKLCLNCKEYVFHEAKLS